MVQVELNNMCINIGANNDSKKLRTKSTATSGKLIKAVHISFVYIYISRNYLLGRLEYNSRFVRLERWGVRGNERKICKAVNENGDWLDV
jgi:hypothetical protein